MSSATSSSDFSLFSLFTAGLACFMPFANAYTQPVGAEPKGNPIYTPGLNSIVPVGQGYNITWGPTTTGTVTLLLLKGPSTNAVPQYAIAEKISNSGSYVWTPSNDLAPGQTGYGIELIDDATGQYQYSTQFGISNSDYSSSSSSSTWSSSTTSSSASASGSTSASESKTTTISASMSGTTSSASKSGSSTLETITANGTTSASTSASVYYTTEIVSEFTTYCPYATSFTMANHTYTVSSATTFTITNCPCTIIKATSTPTAGAITNIGGSSGYAVASTGGISGNGSIVHPTGTMSVPSSLLALGSATGSAGGAASATGSSGSAVQTGAAASVATSLAGLVVAAGVAVFAL